MSEISLIIPGSGNNSLASARGSFRAQLETAAEGNTAYLAEEGYTPLEIRAVQKVEQMRLLGGFELLTLLERGQLMNEIEQEGLVTVYPGEYRRLEDIAQSIGISKSEYSDTRALCDVIFPWLEAHTERSLAEWWEEIGKSKFRELVPILRGLIEGESARNHETVNEAIRAQLDNAMAGILTETAQAARRELVADEIVTLQQEAADNGSLQRRAILNVLEFGTLPVREMRQRVRPNRTPNIIGTLLRGVTSYAVLRMSPEQVEMFQNLMGTHVDMATVEGEDYSDHIRFLGRMSPLSH